MSRRFLLLITGTLLIWSLIAYPTYRMGGWMLWLQSLVAMAVCLVPACLTLVIGRQSLKRSFETQLLAMFGGIGIRMAFVLSVGFLLFFTVPEMHTNSFWIWLGVFYLITLGLESCLLLINSVDNRSTIST